MIDLTKIPNFPQRQDSVAEQFADLRQVANRLGMYDAADTISQWVNHMPRLNYGCHCDIGPGETPDSCLIDEGNLDGCVYARRAKRKENCEYWRIITI